MDELNSCENAQANFGFEHTLIPHFSITFTVTVKMGYVHTLKPKVWLRILTSNYFMFFQI